MQIDQIRNNTAILLLGTLLKMDYLGEENCNEETVEDLAMLVDDLDDDEVDLKTVTEIIQQFEYDLEEAEEIVQTTQNLALRTQLHHLQIFAGVFDALQTKFYHQLKLI